MRVAVTGAQGGLGRAVVDELLAHGFEIVAIDRIAPVSPGGARDAQIRVADLMDAAAAYKALDGCDALVHLAAHLDPRVDDGPTVFANNTQSVFNVLHAAALWGITPVIYASSQSALGNPWAPELQPLLYVPVDEEYPCTHFNPYGLSKWVGEHICTYIAISHGLPILSLRLPAIWPPTQHAQRIAGRLTDQLQAAKSLWAYIDLRDAARAFRLALQHKWQGHVVLNITSRWAFGAVPMPELLARWYPELHDIRIPVEQDTALFDWRKAESVLGMRTRYRWTQSEIIDTASLVASS